MLRYRDSFAMMSSLILGFKSCDNTCIVEVGSLLWPIYYDIICVGLILWLVYMLCYIAILEWARKMDGPAVKLKKSKNIFVVHTKAEMESDEEQQLIIIYISHGIVRSLHL